VDPIAPTTPTAPSSTAQREGRQSAIEPVPVAEVRFDRLELIAIAAGGALGALARVGLSQAYPTTAGSWPWATFAVNMAGAFLLGCLLAAVRRRERMSIPVYRLLGTGFCGTATTFSTMQGELLKMLDQGRYGLAVGYVVVSIAGGYAAVSAGVRLVGRTAKADVTAPGMTAPDTTAQTTGGSFLAQPEGRAEG
jgi:fluoride exporter